MKSKLATIVFLAAAAAAQGVPASGFAADPETRQAQANVSREETLYSEASDLLDDGRWQQAADRFAQVASLRGRRADAALYWRAYALAKAGRRNEATANIAELRKSYPQSKWVKDAAALELELRQSSGQRVNPDAANDEELKLLALNSLMNSDDERAVPMLEQFLKSNNSRRLKKQALFVLSQSDSPRAQQIIASVARGQNSPELQREAIQMIATNGSKQSIQTLTEVYAATNDPQIKKNVLQAFLTADAKANVLAVARNERDQSLRREAIRQLGAMDAKAELRQMYQAARTAEDKKAIIEACGVADDTELLANVARTAPELDIRKSAIQALGITDNKKTRDLLLSMYNSDQNHEVRRAIVQALFVQDDAHDLIELARRERDPEMRKHIVEQLATMDDKEAKQFMIDLLNK